MSNPIPNSHVEADSSETAPEVPRILIVDDDEEFLYLIQKRFRKLIRNKELRLDFASDGNEALEILKQNPDIHLVFTDLNMPGMDGFTFLEHMNDIHERILKAVVISAYGDMANIRRAMNEGSFDFLTKPIDFKDFETTIRKGLGEVSTIIEGEVAKEALQSALLEKAKAEQSEEIKKQFFSNITHELRTPLTLILGPLENISSDTRELHVQRQAQMALRNSRLLHRLINQLLDLSKLEAGSMHLRPERGDLFDFMREKVRDFQALAKQKSIELSFSSGLDTLPGDFDPDKMEKVVNNLLSNALKFSPKGGKVLVSLSAAFEEEETATGPGADVSGGLAAGDAGSAPGAVSGTDEGGSAGQAAASAATVAEPQKGTAIISVRDNGPGIPADQVPFIFDRFYQVDQKKDVVRQGTGIGLALSKELMELHGGSLVVNSIEGLGSEFVARLPMLHEGQIVVGDGTVKATGLSPDSGTMAAAAELVLSENVETELPELPEDHAQKVILIVDDNPDVRNYVRLALADEYTVVEAIDGDAGVDRAITIVPDLIVSDVLMPGRTGFELCDALKTDARTSHIPIILLTARSGMESKLEGLETGADAYLTKPFNVQELQVQVRNLIQLRGTIMEKFRQEFLTKPELVEAKSMDEEFLLRLKKVLSEFMSDESFSVEQLSREMGMSRTQLHRKLRALLDTSASEFIRNYRLDQAKQLLEQNAGSVGEIAYRVGFGSASYFTKCFTERFGVSPKVVRKG